MAQWSERTSLGPKIPGSNTVCALRFFLNSLFKQQRMGTWLSSGLGKVKVVRQRSGAPLQLTLSVDTATSQHGHLA